MPISIGIPFYNAEPYLADAIRSVFAQTYQDWELILVDDGSTDRSLEIAHSLEDSRVRVISDGKNRKLAYRLNQITSLSRYDYLARMDADDLMSPHRLESELSVLESNLSLDLVTTGVCSLSNDNKPIGVRVKNDTRPIDAKDLLLGRSGIVHAAVLGRKSWFLRNPYKLTDVLAEDYELWLSAFSKNDLKIHIIPEPLYYYRESGNITKHKMLTAYNSQRQILKRYGHLGFSPTMEKIAIGKFHLKDLAVRALSCTNTMDALLSKRNNAITDPAISERFLKEIESILSTKVNGLEQVRNLYEAACENP